MADPVVIVEREGAILIVTLNRPEKLNAITADLMNALLQAVDEARAEREVGCIVIQGAGRAFCSGWDLTPPASAGGPFRISHPSLITISGSPSPVRSPTTTQPPRYSGSSLIVFHGRTTGTPSSNRSLTCTSNFAGTSFARFLEGKTGWSARTLVPVRRNPTAAIVADRRTTGNARR